MTRIINLRQARKQRERAARRAEADQNAARHGEAKPLAALRKSEADRRDRQYEAHRLDTTDDN